MAVTTDELDSQSTLLTDILYTCIALVKPDGDSCYFLAFSIETKD